MSLPKAGPFGHAFNAVTRRSQIKDVLGQFKLDWNIFKMALKLSIPPALLVCCIQSDKWINHFTTNAYLASILSVCAMPTLPTAKLIESNFRVALVIGIFYAFAIFTGWCGLKARQNTSTAGDLQAYNSSAEAVVALLLIFSIWLVYSLRSAFQLWAMPLQLGGIFAVAAMPGIARAPDMSTVIEIASITVEAFLAGQAIGFLTGLLIFPSSCRAIFMKDLKICLEEIKSVMRAQEALVSDFKVEPDSDGQEGSLETSVGSLKSALQRLISAVAKTRSDSEYAEREFAYSRLDHSHLSKLGELLVGMIPPLSGLSSAADMLCLSQDKYQPEEDAVQTSESPEIMAGDSLARDKDDWHKLAKSLRSESLELADAVLKGAEHAILRLESFQSHSLVAHIRGRTKDEENNDSSMNPGQADFLASYQKVLKKSMFGEDHLDGSEEKLLNKFINAQPEIEKFERVQGLLSAAASELCELLLFIESTHQSPKRFIWPRFKHMKLWFAALFHLTKSEHDHSFGHDYVGEHPKVHIDPDHLPAQNYGERFGDRLRHLSSLLGSEHAGFGARGACAIMSIAIIAFLKSSQEFFFKERFLWALFAILLSMGKTAGLSTFALLCRFLGTLLSMIASYIIWYVPAQKTPVVVFPPLFGSLFTASIAATVMIANELQVRKLSPARVAAFGQSVYAPYIIFPYRLAIVTLGIFAAYFWTLFPFPIAEHGQLRKDVASSFYVLANYYIQVQQTIIARLNGKDGDLKDNTSTSACLARNRQRLFRKYQGLRGRAQMGYKLLDWEFAIGGRFPKETYFEILNLMGRLESYMTLIAYVAKGLPAHSPKITSWWHEDTVEVNSSPRAHLCPEGIATRMITLHSSLFREHPLPPSVPRLKIPDVNDFLSQQVPGEEGFAAASLIHSVNWFMIKDINTLTKLVRDLVGQHDFSITIDLPNPTLTKLESDSSVKNSEKNP